MRLLPRSIALPAAATATAVCALGLVLGLGACSHDKPAPPAQSTGQGSGSAAAAAGSAAATTTAPAASGVTLSINGSQVATIDAAQLATWPRLDGIVPAEVRKLGTWESVSLQGASAQPTEVNRPSSSFPDMVPAVFPGDGGAPAFGMFDPVELARKGKPAMRQDHVTAIQIKVAQGGNRGQNDDGGGAAADPTKLTLTVKTASGTTALTGDKLLAIPRESQPGNADQKGWRLAALLDAAGVKRFDRLVLTDASGTTLILESKDLGANTVPFIKLNKQGALRLRVLKKSNDGWDPAGDLRALSSIEVR